MSPPVYCGRKRVPCCTWFWALFSKTFLWEWRVSQTLNTTSMCPWLKVPSILDWFFFLINLFIDFWNREVYLTSLCRDLLDISLTHLKHLCEVHPVPCFVCFPPSPFHTVVGLRNSGFAHAFVYFLFNPSPLFLFLFSCFPNIAILIISCSYVL